MCVCFRTSTSACRCLLTSEFPTATWRSCSSAARPLTSRSADAPAEPRWSVSVVRWCLCVLPLLLCGAVTRLPLCKLPWQQARCEIRMDSSGVTSTHLLPLAHQIRSQYSAAVAPVQLCCGLSATRRFMHISGLPTMTPKLNKVTACAK